MKKLIFIFSMLFAGCVFAGSGYCVVIDNNNILLDSTITDLTQCQAVLLSGAEYSAFRSLSGPFDYVKAGAIYTFFFSFIVGLWWVSKQFSAIANAIKH